MSTRNARGRSAPRFKTALVLMVLASFATLFAVPTASAGTPAPTIPEVPGPSQDDGRGTTGPESQLTLNFPEHVGTDGKVVPMHAVTCTYTARVPGKSFSYISYGVGWTCNDAVDIRSITIKLWKWTGSGYQNVASLSGSNTSANGSLMGLSPCSNNVGTYVYHTYFYVEAFHGNWGTNEGNSSTRTITC